MWYYYNKCKQVTEVSQFSNDLCYYLKHYYDIKKQNGFTTTIEDNLAKILSINIDKQKENILINLTITEIEKDNHLSTILYFRGTMDEIDDMENDELLYVLTNILRKIK